MSCYRFQFAGLPSSGKSTIVTKLTALHPSKYRRGKIFVKQKKDLLNFKFITLLSFFDKSFLFFIVAALKIMFVKKIAFSSLYDALVMTLYNIVNFKLDKNHDDGRIVLWDEYCVQRLFSLYGYIEHNSLEIEAINPQQIYNSKKNSLIYLSLGNKFETRLFDRGLTDRMILLDGPNLRHVINSHKLLDKALLEKIECFFDVQGDIENVVRKIDNYISAFTQYGN
jgi:hypothetical protein